jgi:hypothetical protein
MNKCKWLVIAATLLLTACGSAPNLAGTYTGEAKLLKGNEYIGDTAYNAKLEIKQSSDMATLKISDTDFSEDCSFSGSVNKRGEGKITSAPSCSITVPGNSGKMSVSGGEFFLSGNTLTLKINDSLSGAERDKAYILQFSGTKE